MKKLITTIGLSVTLIAGQAYGHPQGGSRFFHDYSYDLQQQMQEQREQEAFEEQLVQLQEAQEARLQELQEAQETRMQEIQDKLDELSNDQSQN
jgi:hypothetical protein